MDKYIKYEEAIKKNYKRVVHWTIVGDGYVQSVEVSKVPMPIYHALRKMAIFFDRVANKVRGLLRAVTEEEVNIENNFKLPKDFEKLV